MMDIQDRMPNARIKSWLELNSFSFDYPERVWRHVLGTTIPCGLITHAEEIGVTKIMKANVQEVVVYFDVEELTGRGARNELPITSLKYLPDKKQVKAGVGFLPLDYVVKFEAR